MEHGRANLRDHLLPPTHLCLIIMSFLIEFLRFLRVRKKFWLLPIIVMMALFGGLIVMTQGTAVAPFIYTIF
jgi:hypothetical protein